MSTPIAPFAAELKTGHVGLNVRDLNRSKQFYQSVFGFEITNESQEAGREFAFLTDPTNKRLVLTLWQQSGEQFNKQVAGLHHLSFQVATVEEVKEAETRLRALSAHIHHNGIVPHSEGAQSGGIFFEDPDGIRLEIYSPTAGAGHTAPTQGAPTCGFF